MASADQTKQADAGRLLFPALLLLAAAVVYARAAGFGYTNWDDAIFIGENPLVQHPSLRNLRLIFTPGGVPEEMIYIPLCYVSYMVEAVLFGLRPLATHVDNILLHMANALLVFWLFLRLLGRPRAAFAGALLFVVHPLQVEAVAWAMGRKDLLAALAGLLALHAYVKYQESDRERQWLGLALTFFVLAVLSKPTMLVLPALLVLLDYLRHGKVTQAELAALIPFIVVALLAYLINQRIPSGSSSAVPPALVRLAAVPWVAQGWLARFVLAAPALPFHGWPTQVGAGTLLWRAAPTLAVIAVVGVWAAARAGRQARFALAFFLIAFAPALSIVLAHRDFVTADRYGYFPLIGIFFLLASVWGRLEGGRGRVVRVLALVWVLLATGLAWRQVGIWRDSIALWDRARTYFPRHPVVLHNLALGHAEAGNRPEAIRLFLLGLEIKPGDARLHGNLGTVYLEAGDVDAALPHLRRSLAIKPTAKVYKSLGNVLRQHRDLAGAIAAYRGAIERNQLDQDAYNLLGNALSEAGDALAALAAYEKGVAIGRPQPELLYNLALAYEGAGRPTEAALAYVRAIEAKPDFVEAHYNLGNHYLKRGFHTEAKQQFNRVLKLQPEHLEARVNLGIALYQEGNLPGAIAALQLAVEGGANYANVHYYLALAHHRQGRRPAALQALAQALRLKPSLAEEAHELKGLQADALLLLAPKQ